MMLVIGGASSGKSAIAEALCCVGGNRKLYLATMEQESREAQARIRRHRDLRMGKGFTTLECQHSLERLALAGCYDGILLECLGNLTAGELFVAHTPWEQAVDKMMLGIEALSCHTERLVVVTNQLFSDTARYQDTMAEYITCLGRLNRQVAQRADTVIESVCGLPVLLKGEI